MWNEKNVRSQTPAHSLIVNQETAWNFPLNLVSCKKNKMQENNNQTLWQIIKRYFNVLPYKDGEKYVIKQIT